MTIVFHNVVQNKSMRVQIILNCDIIYFYFEFFLVFINKMFTEKCIKVAITGAAGHIANALYYKYKIFKIKLSSFRIWISFWRIKILFIFTRN